VVGGVEHDFSTALDALDRSLALSPSSALAFGFISIIRAWKGDYSIAVAHGEAAIRHSPSDPLIYLPYVGLTYSHFFAGRFQDAVSSANRALQSNPRFSVPCYLRTSALANLGREADAVENARYMIELQPTFTIASLVDSRFTSDEHISLLVEGLRKAGVRER